jgi:hypothetical protein
MGTNIYARLHPDNKERSKIALKIKDAIMTNEPDMYYQIENILDEYKKKYPVIHLGKRSAGWDFLWAPHPEYYQANKQSIDLFLHREDVLLYNEYGDILTPQEVWDDYANYEGMTDEEWIQEHPEDAWMYENHHDVITAEGLRFANTNDFS